METEEIQFYVIWMRWQSQNLYSLWATMPDKDLYWADSQGKIPCFATIDEVVTLAAKLGIQPYAKKPEVHDLDSVWQWLQQSQKLPPRETLMIWNRFSDLGSGVGIAFDGDRKSPLRTRVFDKLYLNDGIVQLNQQGRIELHNANTKPWVPRWKPQERKMLKRVLQQGFRLWQKYTYQATLATVPLP